MQAASFSKEVGKGKKMDSPLGLQKGMKPSWSVDFSSARPTEVSNLQNFKITCVGLSPECATQQQQQN
jgi:hypothetical protein